MQPEEMGSETGHNRTVALIAESRFSYPDEEHPDWTTHVNVPERTSGIQYDSELVYPDLIVVSSKMEVVKIAEVQSKMVVDLADVQRWKICCSLCQAFYLYIPLEIRSKTLQVLNFHRIPYKSLGLYGYDTQGRLLVNND